MLGTAPLTQCSGGAHLAFPKRSGIDVFLRLEYGADTALYRMLRQAMLSRRALLLLDGLDEGGAKRVEIERHVTEVLAPQGHVMLCTSRPAGIEHAKFAGFRRLGLAPLTEAQQVEALEHRLGKQRATTLLPYLNRVPHDTETKLRATANPLMLASASLINHYS